MWSNALVLTVGGPGDRPVPGCRPATPGEGTLDMKRSRPPRPALNRNAVWELPDRLGMSYRRAGAMETPPTVHLPPSRGRPDHHSLPEEAQPGTGPRPPPQPGGVLMKDAPSLRRTPPTPICGNTGLPGGFPAPQGRGGMRLRSPAARGPGGETPPASGPR